MYVQIEYLSRGSCKLTKSMLRNGAGGEKENDTHENNFIESKDFIRHYQEDNWMDLSELQATYSLHIEGTIYS